MKITELNISEFGCLKNVRIAPDEKMNIIYGENESGKSTILLFIKFMLYGLGRRSASNSERERSVSWSGHTAAGSMSFYHGGRQYRIERRFTEAGRAANEKVSVLCLDDGTEVVTDKTPGEYFLGVPKEVFESSACVGQMRSTEINGEKTAASIQNMLTSADESVDTLKILKNLDAVRVEYRHKNRTGGSLWEDEQRIEQQKKRLEKARDADAQLDEWQKKLENAKRDYELVKSDLDGKDRLLAEINKINTVKRFEKLRGDMEAKEALTEKKKRFVSEELRTDFFPDNRHIAELKLCAETLLDAQKAFDEKSAEAADKNSGGYDIRLAELGEMLESEGGAVAVTNAIKNKSAKKKKQDAKVAVIWAIQAILSVLGASFLIGGLVWGAAFFAFVIAAVTVTVRSAGAKRKLDNEIKDIAAKYGATPEELEEKLELCVKNLSLCRAQAALNARLEAELAEVERALDRCRASLEGLMAKTAPASEPDYTCAIAELARLESFISRFDELSREEDTLERIIASEQKALSNFREDELRSRITVNIDEITPGAISEAEKMRSFLSSKKAALEQRVNTLNNTVIELRASAEDPLPVADELAELEAKYACDSRFYSALTLAMESIEKAGQVMRGSVTPAIAAHAGEIMSRISGEKYTTLRTTSTLGLSLDSEGFGVKSDFLSAGTRDAAYLSLRIALFMRIYGEEMPPLILDEALCQLDDIRAERMLAMLNSLSKEGVQCLLFTSHKRESDICGKEGIEYKDICL